jgi:hypothetical protein
MTFLTQRGEGPGFRYAGQPVHILAGASGRSAGFAAMEITIPGHFTGPVPHAHDEFDEAIYVLSGRGLWRSTCTSWLRSGYSGQVVWMRRSSCGLNLPRMHPADGSGWCQRARSE